MKAKQLFVLVLLLIVFKTLYGQSDVYGLKVYGFFQTSFYQQTNKVKFLPFVNLDRTNNSFWLQQMNLFLSKDINENFSAFVNLEFTNSFSTKSDWGTFGIEEAWAKYSLNDHFNVKAGLLTPKFNALNEIKNRSIVLPYIFRPFVYETAIEELIGSSSFIPKSANIEVFGVFPVNDIKLGYSFFFGNSEDSYTSKGIVGNDISGTDTSKFKLFGGHLGMEYGDFKFGVSGTVDKYNQHNVGLGDVNRYRLGADLSFSFAGFNLESEYIKVNHSLTDTQDRQLMQMSLTNPMITGKINKEFYYANLTYNFSDEWYVYFKYDMLKDESRVESVNGVNGYSVGGGFRPVDDILLKAQYQAVSMENKDIFKMNQDVFYIGASIFF